MIAPEKLCLAYASLFHNLHHMHHKCTKQSRSESRLEMLHLSVIAPITCNTYHSNVNIKFDFFIQLIALLIITACQSKTKTASNDADAIRNIENQWTIALQNKDIDKVMSLYSPESVVMKPNNSIYVGLQSIRTQVESDFADTTMLWNTTSTTIDIIEVSASGDMAYARGINQGKMKTLTGIVENSDKWIDIYKKTDGHWKCIVGIWNSNNPLESK